MRKEVSGELIISEKQTTPWGGGRPASEGVQWAPGGRSSGRVTAVVTRALMDWGHGAGVCLCLEPVYLLLGRGGGGCEAKERVDC